MTDEQIDHLIAARNRLTDQPIDYALIRWSAVDHISAVLRDVPAGQRPDVDALLGRICSVFETVEREGERMKRIAAEAMRNQPPIEY